MCDDEKKRENLETVIENWFPVVLFDGRFNVSLCKLVAKGERFDEPWIMGY